MKLGKPCKPPIMIFLWFCKASVIAIDFDFQQILLSTFIIPLQLLCPILKVSLGNIFTICGQFFVKITVESAKTLSASCNFWRTPPKNQLTPQPHQQGSNIYIPPPPPSKPWTVCLCLRTHSSGKKSHSTRCRLGQHKMQVCLCLKAHHVEKFHKVQVNRAQCAGVLVPPATDALHSTPPPNAGQLLLHQNATTFLNIRNFTLHQNTQFFKIKYFTLQQNATIVFFSMTKWLADKNS